ncbi:hypothetical protein D0X08_24425 [Escherichia coli]|nr:hypothetical protein [Escherichia coli]
MFHTIVSIKNDGHYFCRAGGNRPDGLNEPVTFRVDPHQTISAYGWVLIIRSEWGLVSLRYIGSIRHLRFRVCLTVDPNRFG